ncbi:ribokinase [Kiritimatiellota bacterium B12222]|nr:ribokinase [Kiritimatiellota bacterium B12222]
MSVSSKAKICVVGSCNMDLITYVSRMPVPGETIHGDRFLTCFGGKGANQAVMAAKMGADVSMVGKLGDDLFGKDILQNFDVQGIDVTGITQSSDAPTGVAPITVNAKGQNSIIVVAGANEQLSEDDIQNAEAIISAAHILICQMEVPVLSNLKALQLAKRAGVTTVFNPAPAQALPLELYPLCDYFCPNETEAALLTGLPVETDAQVKRAAEALLQRGCGTIVMTMGARGVLLWGDEVKEVIPAERVKAVDSSGAGDCFVGSLSVLLAEGDSLVTATRKACEIATLSVQKEGTQRSYPERKDLLKLSSAS